MRQIIPLIALALLIAGCVSHHTASPRHSKKEAVQIAVSYVRKHNQNTSQQVDLNLYKAPLAGYDPKRQEWYVLFSERQRSDPYNDFVIIVFDSTGDALPLPR
jgi:hypothetical protein